MPETKIIVALQDREHVESLVKLACEMAQGTGADVTALHVVEVGLGLPLDADDAALDRTGQRLLELAHQAASQKYLKEISTRLVRAREAGPAIIREAEDQAADLIVLGYRRKRSYVAKALLGSAVEYVTKHAPCRVIVQTVPAAAVKTAAA
ncbi:MAG TPA: universal stress protein [Terriglobia bacterium]|nr:universal stress protein [Terriglobia bacterium]